MPTQFELPSLGQKDYETLFQELRAAIPRYSDNWTDFNDSDPGITLLQLLAWLGDVTLYRIDALPRELYLNFARAIAGVGYDAVDDKISTLAQQTIRDLNGTPVYLGESTVVMDPGRLAFLRLLDLWQKNPNFDIQAMREACLAYRQVQYRAVTALDFERLAMLVTAGVDVADAPDQKTARAVVQTHDQRIRLVLISARRPQLSVKTTVPTGPGRVRATLTGTISLGPYINISTRFDPVVEVTRKFIEPRILLGTPVEVLAAGNVFISLTGELAVLPTDDPVAVLGQVSAAVAAWLDPLTGWHEGTGWPVGRKVQTHDLARPLASIAGIDHSQPLRLTLTEYPSLRVDSSILAQTSPLGVDPETAVPLLTNVDISAVSETWPLEVGVHARVGIDTFLAGGQG